jgi:hypothetical protein
MRVADLMAGMRTVLNAITLGDYGQDSGATNLTEAAFLSVEEPGQMQPHGLYVLEPVAVVPAQRQSRGGLMSASVNVSLTSRLRPTVSQGPLDLMAAWGMAERVAEVLMRDVSQASLMVDRVEYLGTSPDSGTCAHLIQITAIYEGG